MSLGLMFGHPTDSDEVIMRAFKEAQYGSPHFDEKWRSAAASFFESLTAFQKDILGEFFLAGRRRIVPDVVRDELVRLGTEWRNERIDHQVDWVTRSTWPL